MSFQRPAAYLRLPSINAKINHHQRLLKIIRTSVPEYLSVHIRDCVLNQHHLILYASSAVWASQLRFLSPHIKNIINSQGNEKIQKIQIKAMMEDWVDTRPKEAKELPSSKNIEAMRAEANASPDSRLKRALISLSQTLEQQHKT